MSQYNGRTFAADVYNRAGMRAGRATSLHSPVAPVAVARPVRPHVATDVTVPAGMRRVAHRGEWPTATACVCYCHGNGDESGHSCDVRSCT